MRKRDSAVCSNTTDVSELIRITLNKFQEGQISTSKQLKKELNHLCDNLPRKEIEFFIHEIYIPLKILGLNDIDNIALSQLFGASDFGNMSTIKQVEKSIDIISSLNDRRDIQSSIFSVLEKKYRIDKSSMLQSLSEAIIQATEPSEKQDLALFYIEALKAILRLESSHSSLLLSKIQKPNQESLSFLEPIILALDMNDQTNQDNLEEILTFLEHSTIDERCKDLLLLAELELKKHSTLTPFYHSLIIKIVRYYNEQKQELSGESLCKTLNLLLQHHKEYFREHGFDPDEKTITYKAADLICFAQQTILAILNKTIPESIYLSLEETIFILHHLCIQHKIDHTKSITKLVIENYTKFSAKITNIITNPILAFNLEEIISLAEDPQNTSAIADLLQRRISFEAQNIDQKDLDLFSDISETLSIGQAKKLFDIIKNSGTSSQEINTLIQQAAYQNYLAHLLFFQEYKMADSAPNYSDICKALKVNQSSRRKTLFVRYMNFMLKEYANKDGNVDISSLPSITKLHSEFLFYLAKINDLNAFIELLNLHFDHPNQETIIADLNTNLELSEGNHRYYKYFLNYFIEHRQDFLQDKSRFKDLMLNDLMGRARETGAFATETAKPIIESLEALGIDPQNPPKTKGKASKERKKQSEKRNIIIKKIEKQIFAISDYKTEEELFSLLGENPPPEKTQKIILLRKYFVEKLHENEVSPLIQNQCLKILTTLITGEEELYSIKTSNAGEEQKTSPEDTNYLTDLSQAKNFVEETSTKLQDKMANKIQNFQRANIAKLELNKLKTAAKFKSNIQAEYQKRKIAFEQRQMAREDLRDKQIKEDEQRAAEEKLMQQGDIEAQNLRYKFDRDYYLQKYQEATDRNQESQKEITALQANVQSLQKIFQQNLEQIGNLQREIRSQEKRQQFFHNRASVNEINMLKDNMRAKSSKMNQLKAQIQDDKMQIDNLTLRIIELTKSLANTQEDLETSARTNSQLKKQNQDQVEMMQSLGEQALNKMLYQSITYGMHPSIVGAQKAEFDFSTNKPFSPNLMINRTNYADTNFYNGYSMRYEELTRTGNMTHMEQATYYATPDTREYIRATPPESTTSQSFRSQTQGKTAQPTAGVKK